MISTARMVLIIILVSQLTACAALVVGGAAATGMAVHDRRSVGTVVDDNILKNRIRTALHHHGYSNDQVRLKVAAHNGWVLLAGEAVDQDVVEKFGRTAAEVDGVRELFNELEPGEREGALQSSRDKWISTRVNGALTRIRDLPGFDPTRVKVTTARGNVYLMGLVSSQEAHAAAERARTVRGVERVITIFEYTDETLG